MLGCDKVIVQGRSLQPINAGLGANRTWRSDLSEGAREGNPVRSDTWSFVQAAGSLGGNLQWFQETEIPIAHTPPPPPICVDAHASCVRTCIRVHVYRHTHVLAYRLTQVHTCSRLHIFLHAHSSAQSPPCHCIPFRSLGQDWGAFWSPIGGEAFPLPEMESKEGLLGRGEFFSDIGEQTVRWP